LPLVGWHRLAWKRPALTVPAGMQIDLGGIGKEYAVDRTLQLLTKHVGANGILVNFGGDIAATARRDGQPWSVGIEGVDKDGVAVRTIQMKHGAITTSGDSKKFVLKDGKRYGHILNPLTGFPVENAPRSVTVAAGTCSEAGFLSTMGMLSGFNAEAFLEKSGARYWCFRS
jgi:thiamine biosynthesis lipoprotein